METLSKQCGRRPLVYSSMIYCLKNDLQLYCHNINCLIRSVMLNSKRSTYNEMQVVHHSIIMRQNKANNKSNTTIYLSVNPSPPSRSVPSLAKIQFQTRSFQIFSLWAVCHLFQSAARPTSMMTINLPSFP